jgi:hypothetical protein
MDILEIYQWIIKKFYMFGAEFFFNLCILLIKANKS